MVFIASKLDMNSKNHTPNYHQFSLILQFLEGFEGIMYEKTSIYCAQIKLYTHPKAMISKFDPRFDLFEKPCFFQRCDFLLSLL